MTNRRLLRAPLLLALPLAFIVGACSEDLESGGACPTLCPNQQLDIRDTVLDPAIAFDTTVGDYPFTGLETSLLLASRGDSLDVRGVIRFDSLVRGYRPTPEDTIQDVVMVDSATLDIRLRRTHVPLPASFIIDAYDVGDLTLPDTAPRSLLPLFVAERLLGSVQLDSAGFSDTTLVRVPIDTAMLLDIIQDGARVLRIGLQVRSTESVEVRVVPTDSGLQGPRLRYRVTPDTAVGATNIVPSSSTPATPLLVSFDFVDYVIVARDHRLEAPARMAVGGMPGVRSYLRFELPRWLVDSSTVLRARLELVQDPVRGLDDTARFVIRPQMVLAGHAITDLRRAATLLAPFRVFVADSLVLAPGDSGLRELEINGLVSQWRTIDGQRALPNAMILRSALEGESALGARFFGLGGPVELRPRLRISYVPSTSFTFGRP